MSESPTSGGEKTGLERLRRVRPTEDRVQHERLLRNLEKRLFNSGATQVALARYEILERVGAGGFGLVYRAYDPELQREVAIKLLRGDRQRADGERADQHRQRLIREARAVASLSHPNVVQVYDVGTYTEGELLGLTGADLDNDRLDEINVFVVMEFVRGRTLTEWVRAERPSSDEIVAKFLEAAEGLAAAHAVGIVHRDFKPTNVIVADDGRARVLDFGLARDARSDTARDIATDTNAWSQSQTGIDLDLGPTISGPGEVIGTPTYMSPEQHSGSPGDALSDQYSFCVALVEGLTGKRPFVGRDLEQLQRLKTEGATRALLRRVGRPWRAAVRRGLSVRPSRRFHDVDALIASLRGGRRRARRSMAGTVAAVVAVGGAAAGLSGATAEVCESERIDITWDDARRQELTAAFVGTEVPFAADAATRVARHVDAWVGTWRSTYQNVCRAAVADDFDRRMSCLSHRRTELDALLAVMQEADPETVRRAAAAVERLPAADQCAQESSDDRRVDPGARKRRAAVESALSRAKALRAAGRYREGLPVAAAAAGGAAQFDDPGLMARALLARGSLEMVSGDYPAAEATLTGALWKAQETGDDELAARAAISLVGLVGHRQSRFDEGLRWARHAEAAVQRAGDGGMLRARLSHSLAILHHGQANYAEAITKYQQAHALLEAERGSDHVEVADALGNLGALYRDLGHYEAALEHHLRSLDIYERAAGPWHPAVAAARNNIALALHFLGRDEEALFHHERALAIRRAGLGPDHTLVAGSINNIAIVHFEQGRYDDALQYFRESYEIQRRALGAGHPDTASALDNVGVVLRRQGHASQALAYARRALKLREEALGPTHPTIANSLSNTGRCLTELGHYAEAVQMHRRALEIRLRRLGPTHYTNAVSHTALGDALLGLGRRADAVEHLERAAALHARNHAPRRELAETELVLARALWPEDPRRAIRLARSAKHRFEAAGEGWRRQAAEAEAWLQAPSGWGRRIRTPADVDRPAAARN